MRKDSFWHNDYEGNKKAREAGLIVQAIDPKGVPIIEAEKEEWL